MLRKLHGMCLVPGHRIQKLFYRQVAKKNQPGLDVTPSGCSYKSFGELVSKTNGVDPAILTIAV